jgi:DNA-binding transcriptional ArsR family regulator
LELTECHPRYVYILCAKVWENGVISKKLPDTQHVEQAWLQLVDIRLKDMREVLIKRALGQIKILAFISLGNTTELSGQLAQSKLGMSSSAISQSLRELEQDDFVEKKEDGSYFIIDPLLKATLIKYGSDYFL